MIRSLLTCLLLLLVAIFACSPVVEFSTETISIGEHLIEVDAAHTPEQRNKGLSGKQSIERGMLFLWTKPVNETFWMKDTHIELDIAFVSPDWKIITIKRLEPFSQQLVGSPLPYIAALEMPSGWFSARDIGPGARVQLAE